jgi:hypothetical protein
MLTLADQRQDECATQLWCVGCSITHGVGISADERYGVVIADHLKLPVSFLTASGSSIEWAADQICRSDIRSGDIVVWGLTSHYRLSYYELNSLKHIHSGMYRINPSLKDTVPPARLDSDDNFYHQLTDVFKVINFCNKVGVTLILANLLDDLIPKYITNHPGFIQLNAKPNCDPEIMFKDLGTDKVHPGPKMHRYYADKILKKLK